MLNFRSVMTEPVLEEMDQTLEEMDQHLEEWTVCEETDQILNKTKQNITLVFIQNGSDFAEYKKIF